MQETGTKKTFSEKSPLVSKMLTFFELRWSFSVAVECVRFLLWCGYFCHFFSPAVSPRQKFDKGLCKAMVQLKLQAEKC